MSFKDEISIYDEVFGGNLFLRGCCYEDFGGDFTN